jgi:hypothetical protein
MQPTLTIDAKSALERFSRSTGIPESVRNQLRRTLPDVTKKLGMVVDAKLTYGLKSRNNIDVKKELVENPTKIVGRVRVVWTGDKSKAMVPFWLDQGTRPHIIRAVRARNLYFFWEKIGAFFRGPVVHHPGFAGLHYGEAALLEMEPEIVQVLRDAAVLGANEKR